MEIFRKALIIPYNNIGEILIQDRKNIRKKLYIPWGYFGGGIEKGETPLEAVVKEIYEELLIVLNPSELEFFFQFQEILGEMVIERHVFLWKTELNLKDIKLREGAGLAFVPFEKVEDLMTLEGDKNIARRLKEKLILT